MPTITPNLWFDQNALEGFGLSWQVVPAGMEALFADPDTTRAARAMRAMLGMTKLDLAAMLAAADETA